MCKLWQYEAKCITGRRHREKGLLCQDRVAYREKGQHQVIVLVDGIGKTDRNIIAGEKVAEYTAEFLIERFDEIMLDTPENIRRELLRGIHYIIGNLMVEFEMSKTEFASTVLAVCIDQKTKQYCGVHLGDGIILNRSDCLEILSYPMNGWKKNQTYLTTSENAVKEMKVLKGDLSSISEIILMSDGTYDYPLQKIELSNYINDVFQKAIELQQEDDQGIIRLRRCE